MSFGPDARGCLGGRAGGRCLVGTVLGSLGLLLGGSLVMPMLPWRYPMPTQGAQLIGALGAFWTARLGSAVFSLAFPVPIW